MKLLLIVYTGPRHQSVSELLDRNGITSYTWYAPAHGSGRSGRHEGNRTFPGEETVYFTMLPDQVLQEVLPALAAWQGEAPAGERLHAAVMPVENFI
ncbi:MAG: hypothetical protein ABI742_04060 [Gemmatimonadota bacterium]